MTDDGIHYENPFATPPEKKTPARRLRGRLASGVTIWTSGAPEARAGLTVSSVLVIDGDPPQVVGAISDTTSLWESINESSTFVVHILDASHRALADVFAGLRPNPGGPFAGLEVEDSEFGPLLALAPTRAHCRFTGASASGYQQLVHGVIAHVEPGKLDDPLVYFRGKYRSFRPQPE